MKKILTCAMVAIAAIIALGSCSSCGGKEKKTPVYIGENDPEVYEEDADSSVVVPFKVVGGVKTVDVKINGSICVDMIFDTGCSGTLISLSEARYLAERGLLTEDDLLGVTHSRIADGSIVENMAVNLREVVIGDKILCTNVEATVSNNVDAPLLLGNEVFDRMTELTIDNVNHTLNIK